MKRRALLAACAATATAVHATATGPALERPAVQVRNPARAVLSAATLAGSRIVAVGERGLVILSDDGGSRWTQANVPVSVGLAAVAFADPQRGYACGHGGTVLGSRDAGRSWQRLLDGRQIGALALQAARQRGSEAALRVAERLVSDGPDKPLLALLLAGPEHVFAVGAFGLVVRSLDGGRSWELLDAALDNPKALHLYACRQRGKAVMIAGEQGLLFRSEDSGASFKTLKSPYAGSFFTVDLTADDEMLVGGLRGNLWRSTSAGVTWRQVSNPVQASIVASAARADGSVLFASQAGMLLHWREGTLQPLQLPPLPPLTGLLPLADDALLALTIEGLRVLRTRLT